MTCNASLSGLSLHISSPQSPQSSSLSSLSLRSMISGGEGDKGLVEATGDGVFECMFSGVLEVFGRSMSNHKVRRYQGGYIKPRFNLFRYSAVLKILG